MRPLKTLTFEAFRDELALTFAQIADKRESHRITWEMPAVLMSAFAMLFFQHPSLLEYQRRMQKRTCGQRRRVGWIAWLVTEGGGQKVYPAVLDGSKYLHSTQIHSAHCQ